MASCAKSAPLFNRSISIFTLRSASASLVASSFLRLRTWGSLRGVTTICAIRYCGSDVELRLVGVIEVRDVLIGDGNFGNHFAVDQLLNGKLAPHGIFQVFHRNAPLFELPLELVLGIGALQLGEFVFHFAIAGFQVKLLGALQ